METAAENQIQLSYATGLEIYMQDSGIYKAVIRQPYKGASEPLIYYLVPKGVSFATPPDGSVIRTPVERIICTSTTHIPLLVYLDKTETLVGFPTPDYISSPAMRRHINSGKVTDLGVDKSMNTELALSLEPELVMSYSVSGNNSSNRQLQDLGIPVLINAEYLEEHPLGRAEWIKLTGLLYHRYEESDSIFNSIENEYLKYAAQVQDENERPTAFSGILYGDTWFLPGGNNYASKLMADAGIAYLWEDNEESGFLEISFEAVLDKAVDADLWIGVASFRSLADLKQEDERYGLFRAFQNEEIYTYASPEGATGNQYLELGYLRPDLILSDLIQIAHPGAIEADSMYFYSQLEP